MSIFSEVSLHGCHNLDSSSQSLLLDQDASNNSVLLSNNLDSEDRKDMSSFANSSLLKGLETAGLDESLPGRTQTASETLNKIDSSSSKNCQFFPPATRFSKELIWTELESFWQFYIKTSDRREELKPLLIYILLHLYHHCVRYHSIIVARKLCLDFKKLLQEEKCDFNYKAVVAAMKAQNADCFDQDPILKPFIQNKSPFFLNNATFQSLKNFLIKKQNLVMHYLLTEKIFIRSKEGSLGLNEIRQDLNDEEEMDELILSVSSEPTISSVKRVIGRVRGGTMCSNIPSVSVYMSNGDPCCADICGSSRMAFSMPSGGVRLFSPSDAMNLSCDSETEPDTKISHLSTLNGHRGCIYDLSFHPKSPDVLYTGGQDNLMRCWKLSGPSSECKCVYKGHTWPIWTLSTSPWGNYVATGSMDRSLRIWVPERTQYVRILAGHYMDVICSNFHPNEGYLASGSLDRTVRLWSVANGENVRVFTGAEAPVTSVIFHEGGNYIIGASEERTIKVWDISSGHLVAQIPCEKKIFSLSIFSHYLAAGCEDGHIWFWNIRNIVGGSEDSFTFEEEEDEIDADGIVIPEPVCVPTAAGNVVKVKYIDGKVLYGLSSAS